MVLFSWFGGRDVTRNWVTQLEHDLVVDLDRATLGDTSFEQPIDDVSWLGPAEDGEKAADGDLCYYTRGLCVHVKDRLFVGFHAYFKQPNYEPFTGKVVYHGGTLPTCPSTSAEQAIEWFGQPLDNEDDGNGRFSIEYNHNDNWFELQFDDCGLLESLCVI